jgi:uncharacterized protein (DUF305 family)
MGSVSRRAALIVVPLLLLAAGCTTKTELAVVETTPPARSPGAGAARWSPPPFAEVTYAREVVALHEQALRMVAMAQGEERGVCPALREVADRIGESRMRELDDLAALMDTWGVPPRGSSAETLPGVMSAERLRRLEGLGGAKFEERWLAAMIVNHRTAVALSRAQAAEGSDPALRRLARQVREAEEAQLRVLRRLADR